MDEADIIEGLPIFRANVHQIPTVLQPRNIKYAKQRKTVYVYIFDLVWLV